MKRALMIVLCLVASGCGDPYVYASPLMAEREPGVGEIDVSPNGTLWILEPLDHTSLAIRRYEHDHIAETVPLPMDMWLTTATRTTSPRATLIAVGDRVFVGATDVFGGAGLMSLWQWDGVEWTNVFLTLGFGFATSASRPVLDGTGVIWVAIGAQVARLEADGSWTRWDLPEGLEATGAVAPLAEGVRVLASDRSFERTSVVDIASDGSMAIIGAPEVDPRSVHAVGAIGERPVLVYEDTYVQEVLDLDGSIVESMPMQTEFFDARTGSDGALWMLVQEYLYQRVLVVRVDESGMEYAGAIEDVRTAYYPATHLAPDGADGAFAYGAGIYHATPQR